MDYWINPFGRFNSYTDSSFIFAENLILEGLIFVMQRLSKYETYNDYEIESFEVSKRNAIKCARQLFYSQKCIEELSNAKNKMELNRILVTYRRQIK